jgi:hypothetical protein
MHAQRRANTNHPPRLWRGLGTPRPRQHRIEKWQGEGDPAGTEKGAAGNGSGRPDIHVADHFF